MCVESTYVILHDLYAPDINFHLLCSRPPIWAYSDIDYAKSESLHACMCRTTSCALHHAGERTDVWTPLRTTSELHKLLQAQMLAAQN
jgi:hypothetical protein